MTRLKSHCAWKYGDGTSILAGQDKWVNGSTPTLKPDMLPQLSSQLTVVALISPSDHSWKSADIRRFFMGPSARQILGMELPLVSHTPDVFYWPYTKSGQFTTKSAYALVIQQQQHDICSMTDPRHVRFFHTLWHLNVMPKWKLFLWKLSQNGLASSENLFWRGLGTSDMCSICLCDNESRNHLFRACPLVEEAWALLDFPHLATASSTTFEDWLMGSVCFYKDADGATGTRLPHFIATLWAIWLTRNAQVFRQIRATVEGLRRHFDDGIKQHSTFAQLSPLAWQSHSREPPTPGFFFATLGVYHNAPPNITFRIDGSWLNSSQ